MAGCQHSRLLQCYQRSVWYFGGVLHSQDVSSHVSRSQGNVLYVLMSILTTLRSRIALVDNTCIGHMHLSQFVSEVLALLMDYLIHVCMEWTVTANIHIISRSRFILF